MAELGILVQFKTLSEPIHIGQSFIGTCNNTFWVVHFPLYQLFYTYCEMFDRNTIAHIAQLTTVKFILKM